MPANAENVMNDRRTIVRTCLAELDQITERIDRDRATGGPTSLSARWSAVLGRPASTALVSFRIGHPERAAGRSPRRPLEETTR